MFVLLMALPAMAAKPGSDAGPQVQLKSVFTNPQRCTFVHIPENVTYTYEPSVDAVMRAGTGIWQNVTSTTSSQDAVLRVMIALTGYPLSPEDFIDAGTGEYICTTPKLLELLGY
jgi:hypothetical protein